MAVWGEGEEKKEEESRKEVGGVQELRRGGCVPVQKGQRRGEWRRPLGPLGGSRREWLMGQC